MTLKNIIFPLTLTTIVAVALFQTFVESQTVSLHIKERIITDFNDVLNGVLIDFAYNESHIRTNLSEGLSSVPGCPKSDEGYPWVYYGSPPKCYLAGQQGPCDLDQTIFVKDGSPFGYCNCKCLGGIQLRNPLEDQFCKPNPIATPELVYLASEEKCYEIYDQGPCGKDKWIVKAVGNGGDGGKKTICEKRTCPAGQIPTTSADGEQGCGNHFYPYSLTVGIAPNECESRGMRYSKLRKQCVNKLNLLI